MKILIVDNLDSFTFNLYHYVQQFNDDVTVIKNTKINLKGIDKYDKIILSPGPGLPDEHKNLKSIIQKYFKSKSILGVCLGHQAIIEFFGGRLINLGTVKHGVSTRINISNYDYLFQDIPNKISVGHYHSWIADAKNIPTCFKITSKNDDGIVMSIKHKVFDVIGVQFHPESILTEYGVKIIENWIKN